MLEDGFSIDRDRAWQKEICSSGSQLDMLVAAFEVSFPNGDRIIDKRRGSLLRGPTWAIFHDTRQEVARRFNRVVDLLFQNSGYIRNIRKDFDHMGRLERSSHDPTITIPFMNGFRSHISKPRGKVTSRQFKATDQFEVSREIVSPIICMSLNMISLCTAVHGKNKGLSRWFALCHCT